MCCVVDREIFVCCLEDREIYVCCVVDREIYVCCVVDREIYVCCLEERSMCVVLFSRYRVACLAGIKRYVCVVGYFLVSSLTHHWLSCWSTRNLLTTARKESFFLCLSCFGYSPFFKFLVF